jgi:hypothetical protein
MERQTADSKVPGQRRHSASSRARTRDWASPTVTEIRVSAEMCAYAGIWVVAD